MPHLCAVYGCSHNSKREKGLFKFFRFPPVIWNQGEETRKLTEERRRKWLVNVKRADLDGKKLDHYRVCIDHFISGKTSFQIIEYNDRFKIHYRFFLLSYPFVLFQGPHRVFMISKHKP